MQVTANSYKARLTNTLNVVRKNRSYKQVENAAPSALFHTCKYVLPNHSHLIFSTTCLGNEKNETDSKYWIVNKYNTWFEKLVVENV